MLDGWFNIIKTPRTGELPEEIIRVLEDMDVEYDWRFWDDDKFLSAGFEQSEIKDFQELFARTMLGGFARKDLKGYLKESYRNRNNPDWKSKELELTDIYTENEMVRLKNYTKKINDYIDRLKEWKKEMS
jgi:hypothetical protein